MEQITSPLTDEEQLVFGIIVQAYVDCGAVDNLRVAVAWPYSVGLLKIVLVCDNFFDHLVPWEVIPRAAEIRTKTMTTHTTEVQITIPIATFLRQWGRSGQ